MTKLLINKRYASDLDLFDVFILIAFSYNSLMVYFSALFSRLPFINMVGYQILPISVALVAILCFACGYFSGVKARDVLFLLCFVMVIILSYTLHPETQKYYTESNMRNIYVEAIPFFMLGLSFRCNLRTMRNLAYISCIAIVINLLYMFFYVGLTAGDGDYYRGQAYFLLPHVMFVINSIFDESIIKKKSISIIFSLLGIIFLVAMGTRGPLLISIVFLLIKSFLQIKKKSIRIKLMFLMLCIALGWLISSDVYLMLMTRLTEFLSSFGMSTRVIDLLLENEYLSNTSGRDKIYELLFKKILEKPIWGYGIFGEEQFGVFAHNIMLEIIVYYGIPLGVIIIVTYVTIALKAYFKSNNKISKDLILLFMVMTFVHSFFGGSQFSYYFCFLLGLSIKVLRQLKQAYLENCEVGEI